MNNKLETLPRDMLRTIFLNLTGNDLVNVNVTNKRFHQILSDAYFKQQKYNLSLFHNAPIPNEKCWVYLKRLEEEREILFAKNLPLLIKNIDNELFTKLLEENAFEQAKSESTHDLIEKIRHSLSDTTLSIETMRNNFYHYFNKFLENPLEPLGFVDEINLATMPPNDEKNFFENQYEQARLQSSDVALMDCDEFKEKLLFLAVLPRYILTAMLQSDCNLTLELMLSKNPSLAKENRDYFSIFFNDGEIMSSPTALHLACGSLNLQAVTLLLKHGANVNETQSLDMNGDFTQVYTPLTIACLCANENPAHAKLVIQKLLKEGADIHLTSCNIAPFMSKELSALTFCNSVIETAQESVKEVLQLVLDKAKLLIHLSLL